MSKKGWKPTDRDRAETDALYQRYVQARPSVSVTPEYDENYAPFSAKEQAELDMLRAEEAARVAEFENPIAVAQTAVESTLGAATFGGSDFLARKLAPEFANRMAERRARNEGAALLGNVLEPAAEAVLTGGASLAARAALKTGAKATAASGIKTAGRAAAKAVTAPTLAGKAVESAVAKRLGDTVKSKITAKALGTATEVGARSAGNELSQASLEDREITAGNLLVAAGAGALAGLPMGAAPAAIGVGLKSAARRTKPLLEAAAKKVGAKLGTSDDVANLGISLATNIRTPNVARYRAMQELVDAAPEIDQVATDIIPKFYAEARERLSQGKTDALGLLSDAPVKTSTVLRNLRKLKRENRYSNDQIANQAVENVLKTYEQKVGTQRVVGDFLEDFGESNRRYTGKVREYRENLLSDLRKNFEGLNADEALRRLSRFKRSKDYARSGTLLKDLTDDLRMRARMARDMTLSERDIGRMVREIDDETRGQYGSLVRAPAEIDALKQVRNRLDTVLKEQNQDYAAAMIPQAERTAALNKFEEFVAGRVGKATGELNERQIADRIIRTIGTQPGKSRQVFEAIEGVGKAFDRSDLRQLIEASAIKDQMSKNIQAGSRSTAYGAAVGGLLGMLLGMPTVGATAGAIIGGATDFAGAPLARYLARQANRVGTVDMARMVRPVIQQAQRVSKALDEFVSDTRRVSAPTVRAGTALAIQRNLGFSADTESKVPEFRIDEIRDQVDTVLADPDYATRIAQELVATTDVPEDVAVSMGQSVVRAAQALSTRLPPRETPVGIQPQLESFPVDKGVVDEIDSFLQGYRNPYDVIANAASGRVDRSALDAVKELHAPLYAQFQRQIRERAAQLTEDIPYSKKLVLQALLDEPIDPLFQPKVVRRMQGYYAQAQAQEQKQQTRAIAPSRAEKIVKPESLQTNTQRIAMGM